MSIKTIAIAADHAGYELKESVSAFLKKEGVEVLDLGTHAQDRVDYPDFGYALARAISDGKAERGIVICGSGVGISIAANRHPSIRAAVCHDIAVTKLAREHNDINVLALGARLIDKERAIECVKVFLDTEFEGGRHEQRVEKLGNPKGCCASG